MSNQADHELTAPAAASKPPVAGVGSQRSVKDEKADANSPGLARRLRSISVSLLDAQPPPGMWAASGTAIAHAPNLTQLRSPELSENIGFDAYGHTTHIIPENIDVDDPRQKRRLSRARTLTLPISDVDSEVAAKAIENARPDIALFSDDHTKSASTVTVVPARKHAWTKTVGHGLKAFWKFARTPTGFCIIIYGLNIVAWGAMLFFLLLNTAPAMNHPSADSVDSPRKKWIEVDSQILNALFCVTGFGLAPWRFQDLYFLLAYQFGRRRSGLQKLAKKYAAWYRLPADWQEDEEQGRKPIITATGVRAPATSMWKLWFFVVMFVLNTVLQCVLSFFMWHYNRINRPTWATGLFIGLGCGSSMLAGILTWWEGRKIKIIEGPMLVVEREVVTEA
ncbi:MAG: hypothetical protein M1818_005761 [Claussenomyces sp. TS43310]|nr:MAG: hypothetical protein M1818_005761 [Claussenomyces sp. TS43310]